MRRGARACAAALPAARSQIGKKKGLAAAATVISGDAAFKGSARGMRDETRMYVSRQDVRLIAERSSPGLGCHAWNFKPQLT